MSRIHLFLKEKNGSTAVEFAIVASFFVLTVLFIMTVSVIVYVNIVLDGATSRAARLILTGNVQSQAPPATLATFTQTLCGNLPPTFRCSNLIVNLYTVSKSAQPGGYYAYVKSDLSGLNIPTLVAGSGQFALGSRGDYQYLEVIYPLTFIPTIFASILSAGTVFNGKPAYPAISTAAFRNEQY